MSSLYTILQILSKKRVGKVGRAETEASIGQLLLYYINKCGLCALNSTERERDWFKSAMFS